MNKIWVNFTKNLFKFYTCFSENCRGVWQFDEIQIDVEKDYKKFSWTSTIYKNILCWV